MTNFTTNFLILQCLRQSEQNFILKTPLRYTFLVLLLPQFFEKINKTKIQYLKTNKFFALLDV